MTKKIVVDWKNFISELGLLFTFFIGYDSLNKLSKGGLSTLAGCFGLIFVIYILFLRNIN